MVLPKGAYEVFQRKTLTKMARAALRQLRPHMPSRAMRRDSFIAIDRNQIAYVVIPYYWALYVHEGRGSLRPGNPPKFLVWFANKRDDPRTRGGTRYPRREKDRVRLTKAQWDAGLRANKARRKRGLGPYMIVRKFQGKHTQANRFIDRALSNFSNDIAPVVWEEWTKFMESQMISDRATARMRVFS